MLSHTRIIVLVSSAFHDHNDPTGAERKNTPSMQQCLNISTHESPGNRHASTMVVVELRGTTWSQMCPWHGINVSSSFSGSLPPPIAPASSVSRPRCVSTSSCSSIVVCRGVPLRRYSVSTDPAQRSLRVCRCVATYPRARPTVLISPSIFSALSEITLVALFAACLLFRSPVRFHATRSYSCFTDVLCHVPNFAQKPTGCSDLSGNDGSEGTRTTV